MPEGWTLEADGVESWAMDGDDVVGLGDGSRPRRPAPLLPDEPYLRSLAARSVPSASDEAIGPTVMVDAEPWTVRRTALYRGDEPEVAAPSPLLFDSAAAADEASVVLVTAYQWGKWRRLVEVELPSGRPTGWGVLLGSRAPSVPALGEVEGRAWAWVATVQGELIGSPRT